MTGDLRRALTDALGPDQAQTALNVMHEWAQAAAAQAEDAAAFCPVLCCMEDHDAQAAGFRGLATVLGRVYGALSPAGSLS